MIRIAYVSEAHRGLTWAEVGEINVVAARHNEAAGITGLLLFDGGRFLQVLEGELDVVAPLMRRILADPRHTNVRIVLRGPLERRCFADWSMRCQEVTTPEDGRSFADAVRLLVGHRLDDALAEALEAFGAGLTAEAA